MKYSEILAAIDGIFYFFKYHNKNLTKAQAAQLAELQDLIHELRNSQ